MQCPVCCERLREVHKNGITLNLCADCKGAWMERPELERLFAGGAESYSREETKPYADDRRYKAQDDHPRENDSDDDHRDRLRGGKGHSEQGRGRRREGFFGNIMDMFGD